jgi:hypothetical protein
MKIVLPLLTVLLLASAHATESSLFGGPAELKGMNRSVTSMKSWQDVHKMLKQSPFKMNLSINSNFSESYDKFSTGEQFKSNFIFEDLFLAYNYDRNNTFRLNARTTQYIAERSHTETTFRHVALRYQRRNILTQAEHGIDVSAENHQAYLVDEKFRNSRGADGFTRTGINISRQFTPSFSLDLNLVNFINYRNTSSRQTTYSTQSQYYNRVILTPNYMFNETYTGSLGIFYDKGVLTDFASNNNLNANKTYLGQTDSPKTDEWVWVDPALNIVVNNWFNMDFDFAWIVYRSHDKKRGWDGFYKKIDNRQTFGYWIGASLNFTVF